MTLDQILTLVGPLDDLPGDNSARGRFRKFLRSNIHEVGQLREFIEQCLQTPGENYSRALQDVVNHLGILLGFDVRFGRYSGVRGKNGFDGIWASPSGLNFVAEINESETQPNGTSAMMNEINSLISEKVLPSDAVTIGLYIFVRPNGDLTALQLAITEEKKTDLLRIVSTDSLLTLVELKRAHSLTPDDVLGLMRPTAVSINPLVELISKIVTEEKGRGKALAFARGA